MKNFGRRMVVGLFSGRLLIIPVPEGLRLSNVNREEADTSNYFLLRDLFSGDFAKRRSLHMLENGNSL